MIANTYRSSSLEPDQISVEITNPILIGKAITDKDFSLRCIDLTNISLATKEDKLYNIDKWATFLKADSWEVIKMLASQDPHIKDAAKRLYLANTDEQLRNLAFDIEEHQLFIRSMKSKIATLTRENEEMSAAIADKEAAIAKEKADNERLRSLLAENNINFDL